MDSNLIKQIFETAFDAVASQYDENEFFAISAKKLADLVPSSKTMKVVDISTGTGSVAIEVASKHHHADIEAIDRSQGMLDIARAKAEDKGIKNISFRQCDVDDLKYDDESLDVVTCGCAIYFYPDMKKTYKHICKTIKPGGMFIFSSFAQEAFSPFAELYFDRLESDFGIKLPPHMKYTLRTEEQIKELVTTSKFKSMDIVRYPIRYSITVNDWWTLINNAGFKATTMQLNEDQLNEFKESHLRDVEEMSKDGHIELNTDTFIVCVML